MIENCEHEFEQVFEETESLGMYSGDIEDMFNGEGAPYNNISDIVDSAKLKSKSFVHSICKKCGKILSEPCRHNFVEVYDTVEKINLSEEKISEILNMDLHWYESKSVPKDLINAAKTREQKLVKIYCDKCGLVV